MPVPAESGLGVGGGSWAERGRDADGAQGSVLEAYHKAPGGMKTGKGLRLYWDLEEEKKGEKKKRMVGGRQGC